MSVRERKTKDGNTATCAFELRLSTIGANRVQTKKDPPAARKQQEGIPSRFAAVAHSVEQFVMRRFDYVRLAAERQRNRRTV